METWKRGRVAASVNAYIKHQTCFRDRLQKAQQDSYRVTAHRVMEAKVNYAKGTCHMRHLIVMRSGRTKSRIGGNFLVPRPCSGERRRYQMLPEGLGERAILAPRLLAVSRQHREFWRRVFATERVFVSQTASWSVTIARDGAQLWPTPSQPGAMKRAYHQSKSFDCAKVQLL